MAATVVFSYASLLPAGLFGFLWWVGGGQASAATISFLELVCLYGYSLTIYIPVSSPLADPGDASYLQYLL